MGISNAPYVAHSDEQVPSSEQTAVEQRPTTTGLSWASALRSNLVSAIDVVRHVAGDKIMPGNSADKEPNEQQLHSPEDRFTPLALRPARKSLGAFPVRRGTKEEDDLVFGGNRPLAISASRSKPGSDDDTGSVEWDSTKDGRSSGQAVIIGGLGRFSFEQRMGRIRGFRPESRNSLAVHSTALSRRRSGMASGSNSHSNSGVGSDAMDATMRKRRLGGI